MAAEKLTLTIPLPGHHFGADFYVKAVIEVTDAGTPETGRGYLADPWNYDAGSAPEWSVFGTPELFLDCGGDGETVTIGPEFANALRDLIEDDKAIKEQVEEKIAKGTDDSIFTTLAERRERAIYRWREREADADFRWRERRDEALKGK